MGSYHEQLLNLDELSAKRIEEAEVENLEEVDEGLAHVPGLVGRQVIMAHRVASEKAGVLGVKAEYETDADGVQDFW